MSIEKLQKHRKEIVQNLKEFGYTKDGGFAVVGKMDLGFLGRMRVEVFEHPEVIRAQLAEDLEWEKRVRQWVREQQLMGKPIMLEKVIDLRQPNTWFAEGITKVLDVALSYATQQQYHYFLVGINDVTPVEGWTLGTSGTKIRTTFGEFTTYDEANRVTWVEAGSAAKTITNSASPGVITCNDVGTLRGACLVSANNKSGTGDDSGYAIAGSRFSADIPAASGNVVNITHTLSGSVT